MFAYGAAGSDGRRRRDAVRAGRRRHRPGQRLRRRRQAARARRRRHRRGGRARPRSRSSPTARPTPCTSRPTSSRRPSTTRSRRPCSSRRASSSPGPSRPSSSTASTRRSTAAAWRSRWAARSRRSCSSTTSSAGLEVVNAYGAEHLEIQTVDAAALAERVTSAGAIFVGPYSPVSLGDYMAGSNHVLPTGGCAHFTSGLGVHSFLRAVQVIEYDADALARGGGPDRRARGRRGPARTRRGGTRALLTVPGRLACTVARGAARRSRTNAPVQREGSGRIQ